MSNSRGAFLLEPEPPYPPLPPLSRVRAHAETDGPGVSSLRAPSPFPKETDKGQCLLSTYSFHSDTYIIDSKRESTVYPTRFSLGIIGDMIQDVP